MRFRPAATGSAATCGPRSNNICAPTWDNPTATSRRRHPQATRCRCGRRWRTSAGTRKKLLPLGVVMDERVATGIEYSRFFAAFERYLKRPELLEVRLDGQRAEA